MSDREDFAASENATTPGGRIDTGETFSLIRSYFDKMFEICGSQFF